MASASGKEKGITALEPELENYLARVSPSSRRSLRNYASGLSPQQQREFLASMQMGDIRFQSEVQARMPEEADLVDPSRFRLHTFRGGSWPTKGIYVPKNAPEGRTKAMQVGYEIVDFPLDPDTVNVFGVENANPRIQAHEYRHRQGIEGIDKDRMFGTSEIMNRFQDLMGSKNKKELLASVELLSDAIHSNRLVSKTDRDKAKTIYYAIGADSTLEELSQSVKTLLNIPLIQNIVSTGRRRAARVEEDAPFKDRMTVDDFRRSNFYKTNIEEPSFLDRSEREEPSWLDRLKKAMRNS
tara:strand:- start:4309 stop:5202 length:894 start_codon:yes stop_codon:yes gene_type:complete